MNVLLRRWVGALAIVVALVAQPARADSAADAKAALNAWWGALVVGTPAAVDPVLTPEFQIMRADGSGYDKKGYLAGGLPKVAALPIFSQVAVTARSELLVVRYYVTVHETRDGKVVEVHAPRLTVFRKDGGKWLVVAHGNFAALEQ